MKPMLLSRAAAAVQGEMSGADIEFNGVSIDSRSIKKRQLFVALKGPRFDGHDFLGEAEKAGAVACLISVGASYNGKMPAIEVSDTLQGLQRLAGYYRNLFDVRMAAITGSNGKTSTKEMLAAILGARYKVLKNTGNLNNQYGIPLSLFNLETEHQAAVMELGMSGFGEISFLAGLVRPQVGIITNAGEGHTEFLKNAENVARAKAELLEALPTEGRAVINFDDQRLKSHISKSKAPVTGFSLDQESDCRAGNVTINGSGIRFTLKGVEFVLPVLGRHNIYNALAAIVAGEAMGVGLKEAAAALREFKPAAMRLEEEDLGKFKLLNDAYNANPQSMRAALEVLGSLSASRKVAVLGDMKELGEISAARHVEMGELAGKKADLVLTAGPNAKDIYMGAKKSGAEAKHFENTEALVRELPSLVSAGDLVLIKASRSMHFEQAVDALKRM